MRIYSIKEIGYNVLNYLYANRKLTVGDLALQCFRSSILVHHYLRNELGISSIITTGSLTRSGKEFYFESEDTIKSRLENTLVEYPKPKFHTWLTIDRYIFDVTLYPTEWYLDQKSGKNQDKNTEDYEQVFINSFFRMRKTIFIINPFCLGKTILIR